MATIDIRKRQIDKIAREFTELVKNEMDVKMAYLYGSYAKGNFHDDSDIDIAIVSNDFTGDPVDDTMRLMRIRRKVDKRIEPRAFLVSEFNEGNPFVKEIIETGKSI